MAYLARDARREQIMNAVIDIVSREGLAAATVRRISQELDCSPGQVHHHFASAQALRAEAVREVWRRIEPKMLENLRKMPPRDRLLAIFTGNKPEGCGSLEPVMVVAKRLWHEAWDIRQDPDVQAALCEGIRSLNALIMETLAEGKAQGVFPAQTEVAKTALRLIAASQGFDLLEQIGVSADLGADRVSYIEAVLAKEGL